MIDQSLALWAPSDLWLGPVDKTQATGLLLACLCQPLQEGPEQEGPQRYFVTTKVPGSATQDVLVTQTCPASWALMTSSKRA